MSDTENLNPGNDNTFFREFQKLGFFLGGICPLLIFIFLEFSGLNPGLLEKNCISAFTVLTVVGIGVGWVTSHYGTNETPKKTFNRIFSFEAFFSIVLIHLVVLYTGGSSSSLFAASYLYLPTVVGYVYGPGKKLYNAVIALSISFALNLFCISFQQVFLDHLMLLRPSFIIYTPSIVRGLCYKIFLFILFGIQMFVVTYIASKDPRNLDANKNNLIK